MSGCYLMISSGFFRVSRGYFYSINIVLFENRMHVEQ